MSGAGLTSLLREHVSECGVPGAALGIRVYTVGAGVEGEAPYPVDDPVFGRRTMMVRSTIDEPTLKDIEARKGSMIEYRQ